MQLFEVVRSTPVSFPEGVPASAALKDLLLGMLEKVGCAAAGILQVVVVVFLSV